jgi:putative addiction module component (TIGR02574 family)
MWLCCMHDGNAPLLRLVEDIWDSIAQEANAHAEKLPLSVTQATELRRRGEDADTHPEDAIPWETVQKELFRRGE